MAKTSEHILWLIGLGVLLFMIVSSPSCLTSILPVTVAFLLIYCELYT